MHTQFWLESLKGGDHSEDLGINKSTILKLISEKLGLGVGLDSSGSG
jgi:hypothetical protein